MKVPFGFLLVLLCRVPGTFAVDGDVTTTSVTRKDDRLTADSTGLVCIGFGFQ